MTFHPADIGYGYKFQRIDLESKPVISADVSKVYSTNRGTTLKSGEAQVGTVEHTLSALYGMKVDNVLIEIFGVLTFANMEMGLTFTGLARAAYEHALHYCHERVQGGVPIIEHQSVKLRLFELWQKVETARATARRVATFNYLSEQPHVIASITSKSYVTQTAFEVASEAIQLLGGNGLTKEYPVEKLMRDASASKICDGENTVLKLKAAGLLSDWYKDNH